MDLAPEQVRDLISMGPSGGRMDAEKLDALVDALPEKSEVTGSVQVWLR